MRDYEVEVMEARSHGRNGKRHYFGMVLYTDNRQQAEWFADDLMHSMTYEEFFERLMRPMTVDEQIDFMTIETPSGRVIRDESDTIGDDHQFSYYARVFRG